MNEQTSRKKFGKKRRIFFRREDDSEGNKTSGSTPEKGRPDSFILNNLEHEKMGPYLYKAIATLAIAGLGGAFFIGFRISSISGDEIAKVVKQVVPNVKLNDDGPTLRTEIQSLKDKDRDLGYDLGKCLAFEPRISFCENWINDPGKKKHK